jgi:hypothetical protein
MASGSTRNFHLLPSTVRRLARLADGVPPAVALFRDAGCLERPRSQHLRGLLSPYSGRSVG